MSQLTICSSSTISHIFNCKHLYLKNLFGEYLGDKYVVIGNFFEELQFPDGNYGVTHEGLEQKFIRKRYQNYYLKVNITDTTLNADWKYGLRNDASSWLMNPTKEIDIVLFTKYQTYFE